MKDAVDANLFDLGVKYPRVQFSKRNFYRTYKKQTCNWIARGGLISCGMILAPASTRSS